MHWEKISLVGVGLLGASLAQACKHKGLVDRASSSGEFGELARPRKLFGENSLAAGNFARLWRLTGDSGHRVY